MLPIIIKDFSRLNLAIKPKFHKKKLSEFYEAVAPIFARAICLNFGGCWRSDFWIFPKNFSIDLLHRSWNGSYFYFFWIGEIANLSNIYPWYLLSFWDFLLFQKISLFLSFHFLTHTKRWSDNHHILLGGVYKPRGQTRGEGGCSEDHNT